jgi:predicted site-specific integrase-resolvase
MPNVTAATATRLLSEQDTAEILGIRPQTLTNWRCTKRVPLPFVRVGRCIRYRLQDVEDFLAKNTVGTVEVA